MLISEYRKRKKNTVLEASEILDFLIGFVLWLTFVWKNG